MAKIKIDAKLFQRAKKVVVVAGYSGMEEFINHIVENEVNRLEVQQGQGGEKDRNLADQLRGLGYID